MSENLKKFNLLGGTINTWGKIAAVAVFTIGSMFVTYYNIGSNSDGVLENISHIGRVENHLDILEADLTDQANKRVSTQKEETDELHHENHRQDDQLLYLTEKLARLEGVLQSRESQQRCP